ARKWVARGALKHPLRRPATCHRPRRRSQSSLWHPHQRRLRRPATRHPLRLRPAPWHRPLRRSWWSLRHPPRLRQRRSVGEDGAARRGFVVARPSGGRCHL
ncbi:hypothetical protein M885DRAFT_626754, partial [Pelagophyceae sp. CCMP2097]